MFTFFSCSVDLALFLVQAGFRKGRGTRDQIANTHWIIEKAREYQKNNYFYFIDYAKAFDCVDHHKLWKILKEMRIPEVNTVNAYVFNRFHQLRFENIML